MSNWESQKNLGETWDPTVDANKAPRMDATKDDYIDGWYIDMKEQVGQYKSNVYVLEKDNGEQANVWGRTVIDDQMKNIPAGSYIRIQWLGRKLKKGSKDKTKAQLRDTDYFQDFEIFRDKSKSRNVTQPTHTAAAPVKQEAGPEDDQELPF